MEYQLAGNDDRFIIPDEQRFERSYDETVDNKVKVRRDYDRTGRGMSNDPMFSTVELIVSFICKA